MVSSAHALARHSNLNASEVRNIAATSCALATLSVTACALASALAWRKRKSWEMVQEVIILILATDLGFCAQYLIVAPRPGSAGPLWQRWRRVEESELSEWARRGRRSGRPPGRGLWARCE